MKIISRLAPTPSGFLHVGNAFNFILTYILTRINDGFLHLRIDDYDLVRYEKKYAQNIFDVLEFLGLDYDGGPRNLSEFESVFSSKFRVTNYKNAVLNLSNTYFCDCSKNTPNAYKNGIYSGICRDKNLAFKQNFTALKIRVDEGIKLGDFVLFRKDGFVAYNLASVVDDEYLGVNFIIRGADLFDCSQAQKFLAKKLNYKFKDCEILHHKLITNNGVKLSKSQKSSPIDFKEKPQIYYKIATDFLGLKSSQSLSAILSEAKEKQSQLKDKFC